MEKNLQIKRGNYKESSDHKRNKTIKERGGGIGFPKKKKKRPTFSLTRACFGEKDGTGEKGMLKIHTPYDIKKVAPIVTKEKRWGTSHTPL